MTKKDHKRLAAAFNRVLHYTGGVDKVTFDWLMREVTIELEADNSRFDAVQFRNACLFGHS